MKGKFHRTASGALVAEGAVVVGDVQLGEESNIWFGSVLRGDDEPIRVGRGVNIQDGCVVHVDLGYGTEIHDYVSIGHKAMIHACTIEEHALIGMGAILLTGCRIGAYSIIGAGALIPEKAVIPPRSLVLGMPGRVRREITDEEAQDNERRARYYIQRAQSYL
ncbi:MAG TPA: gamma carbonic anhydrase family protein [Planctomycetes bacterium]|nr:gamma carbonic anhydrase family protein [Planctomycetota bacterium]